MSSPAGPEFVLDHIIIFVRDLPATERVFTDRFAVCRLPRIPGFSRQYGHPTVARPIEEILAIWNEDRDPALRVDAGNVKTFLRRGVLLADARAQHIVFGVGGRPRRG
jgi:hypothetical protein